MLAMRHAREAAAFCLALFGVLCVLGYCQGCKRPPDEPAIVETIENAAAVAQYKALLADCRKAAVDAGSIAVFDRCADEVDVELCRTRALRCEGGAK